MQKILSHLRISHHMCLIKKAVRRNFAIFTGKHVVLAQAFSCKYYEIFKNICFDEHLQTTASATRKNLQMKMNSLTLLQSLYPV